MLNQRGIFKAAAPRDAEDGWVRQKMDVVGLRVVHELRGISCLALEEVVADKQSCCVSRSFGQVVTDLAVMKEARFTEEQIAFALLQAELGTPVAEVCRKMGISEATYFRWKQKSAAWGRRSCARCASLRRRTSS